MVMHICGPSYSGDGGWRIMVRGQAQQKHKTLYKKQTKSKRTGNVVQVINHLPSKYTVLSSIPSTVKKRKLKNVKILYVKN
jgi:hypothetical protein